jgi:hypothetical protein
VFKEFHYQVAGHGHVREGTPVQDRTGYLSRGGVQVVCLADGAGSASHAEFGAQAVVDEGCRMLVDRFYGFAAREDGAQVRREILERLTAKLWDVAGRRNCEVGDLACTFLCVATSGNSFLGAHVGDGVVGLLRNGEMQVVSPPDTHDFINQTTFVTSTAAAESMRLFRGSLDDVTGFVLMSDGTGESLFDPRTGRLAGACAKLIAAVGSAPAQQSRNSAYRKQLRRLLDTRIRNATKDDCSICVLGREAAA